MKYLNILTVFLLAIWFASCEPYEDRDTLSAPLQASDLKYSVSQVDGYDNKVIVENKTPETIFYWETPIENSHARIDTILFPFAGTFKIKFSAYGGGVPIADSTEVTITANDQFIFSDPYWELLTNGSEGKYWKVSTVYVGPESSYTTNWWEPGLSGNENENDSVYFDLDGGYNFRRYHNGTVESSRYALDTLNDVLELKGDVFMPIYDYGADLENAGLTVNKYRIFKLTEDSLVLGQGASFIPSRSSEDWAWFSVYTKAE